jgi:hypothetical protein
MSLWAFDIQAKDLGHNLVNWVASTRYDFSQEGVAMQRYHHAFMHETIDWPINIVCLF